MVRSNIIIDSSVCNPKNTHVHLSYSSLQICRHNKKDVSRCMHMVDVKRGCSVSITQSRSINQMQLNDMHKFVHGIKSPIFKTILTNNEYTIVMENPRCKYTPISILIQFLIKRVWTMAGDDTTKSYIMIKIHYHMFSSRDLCKQGVSS